MLALAKEIDYRLILECNNLFKLFALLPSLEDLCSARKSQKKNRKKLQVKIFKKFIKA